MKKLLLIASLFFPASLIKANVSYYYSNTSTPEPVIFQGKDHLNKIHVRLDFLGYTKTNFLKMCKEYKLKPKEVIALCISAIEWCNITITQAIRYKNIQGGDKQIGEFLETYFVASCILQASGHLKV